MTDDNGFNQYKMLIMRKINENDEQHVAIMRKLDKLHDDLLTLRVRASIWGGVTGFVVSLLAMIGVKFLH